MSTKQSELQIFEMERLKEKSNNFQKMQEIKGSLNAFLKFKETVFKVDTRMLCKDQESSKENRHWVVKSLHIPNWRMRLLLKETDKIVELAQFSSDSCNQLPQVVGMKSKTQFAMTKDI